MKCLWHWKNINTENISPINNRNIERELSVDDVRGISNTKEIMSTKADIDENVLEKFNDCPPMYH